MKIAVLPGDGIGTEIVAEAVKVLNVLGLPLEMESALVGGAANAGRRVRHGRLGALLQLLHIGRVLDLQITEQEAER